VPAFNVNHLEQIQAIMQTADASNAPVILQASAGARKYAGEPFLRKMVEAAIEMYPHIPIVMHQADLGLFEEADDLLFSEPAPLHGRHFPGG
jgi:fructose/tagatose bisphosphate aldolase